MGSIHGIIEDFGAQVNKYSYTDEHKNILLH